MALLKCPECSGTISDQAITCPHCGYPLKAVTNAKTRSKRHKRPTRAANGTGSIILADLINHSERLLLLDLSSILSLKKRNKSEKLLDILKPVKRRLWLWLDLK